MGFKRKKMQALTLHIEFFVHQRLLFSYRLLCRTAQYAQRIVPILNLIRTNIFKVLRKNNFSSNHNASKNSTTNIQHLSLTSKPLKMVWFYAPFYKNNMFLTIQQAADELSVSHTTIRREVERGALQAVMVRKSYRIDKNALAAYIKSRTTKLNTNQKQLQNQTI